MNCYNKLCLYIYINLKTVIQRQLKMGNFKILNVIWNLKLL